MNEPEVLSLEILEQLLQMLDAKSRASNLAFAKIFSSVDMCIVGIVCFLLFLNFVTLTAQSTPFK